MYRDSYLINKIKKAIPIPVFETTDMPMKISDGDGIIVAVNSAFCLMTGYGRDELINKSFTVLLNEADWGSSLKNHEDFVLNETFEKKESYLLNKLGERILTQETNIKFANEDIVSYKLSSYLDVSEKKNGEYIKSVLFKVSQIVNANHSLEYKYQEIHKLISYLMPADNFLIALKNRDNEISIKYNSYEKLMPDVEEFNKRHLDFARYLMDNENLYLLDFQQIKQLVKLNKIGSYERIPQLILSVPIKIKNEVIGLLLLQNYTDKDAYCENKKQIIDFISVQLSNVIERKHYEEELILARKKAEASDRTKSAFLSQMSHEIRTPLNSILSFSALIRSELNSSLNSEMQECFEMIDRGGRRLIRTFDLILNVAGIQKEQYEPEYTNIYLVEDILRPLVARFKNSASDKGNDLRIVNTTGSVKVNCDFCSLNQVFINLIENALKYTQKGKVEILVHNNSNNNLQVDIKDTGIGISKEFLPEIFNNFTQEESGYTRKFDGNGLGLAIVKDYAEINRLAVKVESNKGKGTTFSVIFGA